MRRTRKSYLLMLVTAVVALLLSTWGTGVSLAQEHDDDHGMDHDDGGGGGSGDPSDPDVPPYGPPPTGRNPGEQRTSVTQGPFNIPAPGPGEHHGHTGNVIVGGEAPCSNCQITSMTAKLVNAAGEEIGNPQNLQLHHMVLFQRQAGRDDATCGGLSLPIPFGILFGERLFASGDERTAVTMPEGYGYPVGTGGWTLIYELANGNDTPQNAYIEMVYDYVPGNTLNDADPVWFDISQCGFSTNNVPAGQHTRTWSWTVNRPGSLIAAGGHQHGNWVNGAVDGGTNLELRRGGANGEILCDSVAGYNESSFYEDGHGQVWLESMSKCGGDAGQAYSIAELTAGEQLTIVGHYDQQTDWPGQMGIMIAYVAPDGAPDGPPDHDDDHDDGDHDDGDHDDGDHDDGDHDDGDHDDGDHDDGDHNGDPGGGECTPPSTSDFAGDGPFDVETENLTNHTIFSPANLGSNGCDRHPVVLWGNGTAAPTGIYASYLEHLASHGFIVAAGNSVLAGAGGQMLEGLDILEQRNQDSGSRFYQMVSDQVGTTGHSQGGGASIQSGKDPRVDAIFPFEPWLQNEIGLTAVSWFLGGENDSVVWPETVRARFDGVGNNIPAAYGELAGATHFTALGDMGGFRGPTTAFARWQLMGDSGASSLFLGSGCELCSSSQWSEFETNQQWQSLPGDGGNGGPGNGGDGQCITASNSEHRDAGRAEGFLVLTAVGSGDSLGLWISTTSLQETSSGNWSLVDSC